jgi:hypothetical protein
VTAHIRLREIAVRNGDRFAEPFHGASGCCSSCANRTGPRGATTRSARRCCARHWPR